MCGICGFTGASDRDLIHNMYGRIRHRGPDDSGFFENGNVNLAIARLSVIDPATGHQPQSNEDDSVWVVFNGEIYNYVELRSELTGKGHTFKTKSDTEVIIHAFEEYGDSFIHHLNGMFAIALWSKRDDTLYLYRDRLGVKPLFYTIAGGQLFFASEIKSLLAIPGIRTAMNTEALHHYLSLRYVPAPLTIYRNIMALKPGCVLKWNTAIKTYTIDRYWEVPFQGRSWDLHEAEEVLEELLKNAVHIRMRSDVPYGALLSGGIDSSLILAMMTEFTDTPIKTFTLGYKDRPGHKKDIDFAKLVSERYNTEHHEYYISWDFVVDSMKSVVTQLDQPFSGVTSAYFLNHYIRKYVTVALSGDGADDQFASYGHHRLVWLIEEIRRLGRMPDLPDTPDYKNIRNNKDLLLKFSKMEPWQWRLYYAAFPDDEKEHLLSRDLQSPVIKSSILLKNIYEQTADSEDSLNRMLALDIKSLLPNEILYYSDLLSMAHAFEVRNPFLDYRVVELAASMPGNLKIRDNTLKFILRKVAARYLPEEIISRPKEGFVLPINTWLKEGMKPMMFDTLSEESLSKHNLFNIKYVRSIIRAFLDGDESLTYRLWTLISFQLWYENNYCVLEH